jgi:predicted DNA-binding transcriptional regulator YafY
MTEIKDVTYAQRQRLQFIEAVAYWEGLVGRPRVAAIFGVSANHITRDFALYRKAFPKNLEYDVTARAYRPGKYFKPYIGSGSPEEYLSLLRTYTETNSLVVNAGIGYEVSATSLPAPATLLDKKILREITRAMHQHYGVKIRYQSLTSPDEAMREIWPHALVFTGNRWHIRAYDTKREKFSDFVLHRILSATLVKSLCMIPMSDDIDWQEMVVVDVTPVAKLNNAQRAVIAKEYGMKLINKKWVWRITLRRCLVPYFIRQYRLDLSEINSYPIALAQPQIALDFCHLQ